MTLLDKIKEVGFDTAYFLSKGIRLKFKDNFVLFQYILGECKFDEEWQLECRGHIIDINSMQFVCRPFDKFFNYGEEHSAKLNEKVFAREKVDGSLIKVWYNKYIDDWVISTNGSIYAEDSPVPNSYINFKDLFLKAYKKLYYKFDFSKENKNFTYMFELCTPHNQIVIQHEDYKIYFLAERNNQTGREFYFDQPWERPNWERPETYSINTLSEALELVKTLKNQEGLVLIDYKSNKLKIKTEEYIRLAYSLDNPARRGAIKWLWEHRLERDELIAYDLTLKDKFKLLDKLYGELKENCLKEVLDCYKYPFKNKKELAEYINKNNYKCKSLLFKIYEGRQLEDLLQQFNYKQFKYYLDLYGVKND